MAAASASVPSVSTSSPASAGTNQPAVRRLFRFSSQRNRDYRQTLFRASSEEAALAALRKELIKSKLPSSSQPSSSGSVAPSWQPCLIPNPDLLFHALLVSKALSVVRVEWQARYLRGEISNPRDVTDLGNAEREVQLKFGNRWNNQPDPNQLQQDVDWLRALPIAEFGTMLKHGLSAFPNESSSEDTYFQWKEQRGDEIVDVHDSDNSDVE